MRAFSKGKWYVDSAGVVRCDDEYDRSIAYLITSEATKELDDANASLIVAAPDMYELLKVCAKTETPSTYIQAFLNLKDKARELLERIDGETSKGSETEC